jgi:hypothetical protein
LISFLLTRLPDHPEPRCTDGERAIKMDLRNPQDRRRWLIRLLTNARSHARQSGKPFDLSPDFVARLYNAQNGRCAVTGIEFHLQRYADDPRQYLPS